MATRISAALVAVALALFAPFAQAQQPFTVPFIHVLNGGTLGGSYTFPGLSTGTQVSCLGLNSANSLVLGSCSSTGTVQNGTAGQIPAYNATGNTVGPLTGALALPGALTLNVGALTSGNSGQTITGSALNSGNYTAATIYAMPCPGCTGFVDGLQSIGTVPNGFGGSQQTGFASYFVDNVASSGSLHNAVGFFSVGVAAANNAAIWAFKGLLTDNTSNAVSSGTGKVLSNELDFNVTSTATTVEGIALSGASLVQPTNANAITCQALGAGITWNGCIISQDGNVQNAMYVGLSGATSGDSLSSQPILFENTDGSGNRTSLVLRALTGNILSDSGALGVAGGITLPDGGTATALYVGLNGATSGDNIQSQIIDLASTDSGGVKSNMSLQASAGSTLALKNTAGNSAVFNIVGSANVIGIDGSSTGNPVAIEANGSDTDVGITVIPKGAGQIWLDGTALLGSGIALSTTATGGFPLIPTTAGTPTGVVGTNGQAAIDIDTADNQLCWSVGSWSCVSAGGGGGGGTVTNVGMALPTSVFTITGSPVTGSGTLTGTFVSHAANTFFSGPSSGSAAAPTFRAIVPADLPVATTSAFGAVKPDGTTITISGGVITAAATSPTGAAGGDLSGTYPNPTVSKINGVTPAPSAVIDATNLSNDTTGQLFGVAALPNLPANSLPMNATGSTGAETAIAIPTCASLAYTAGTPGAFSCGSSGAVTSVGLSGPGIFSITGSPVTTSGTLALSLVNQTANTIWAGPASGSAAAPTFRAMVLADLPSGVAQLATANTFTATQTFATIGGYLANINGQTGTTYTLTSTDCGTFLKLSNASTVTVTLPNNLSIGCEVAIEQRSTGQVVLSPASGASLQSAHSYTKTLGQFSIIGITLDANAGGSSAEYIFSGDGST